jgi:hypothetical protein
VQDGTFFTALDRRNAANNNDSYKRFSNYAEYRVALQESSPYLEAACPWRNASEMCALLSEASLEWCGSVHHGGATVKLFSQIGTSYWASRLAIEHLSQFA